MLTPSTEPSLAAHLETIYLLLSKSKSLPKNLPFSLKSKRTAVIVRQQRTGAIFQCKFDYEVPREVFEKFKANLGAFWCLKKDDWTPTNERQASLLYDFVYSTLNVYLRLDQAEAHQTLARKVNTVVVVYLLSKVLPARYDPRLIASSFHDVSLFTDLSQEELQSVFLSSAMREIDT